MHEKTQEVINNAPQPAPALPSEGLRQGAVGFIPRTGEGCRRRRAAAGERARERRIAEGVRARLQHATTLANPVVDIFRALGYFHHRLTVLKKREVPMRRPDKLKWSFSLGGFLCLVVTMLALSTSGPASELTSLTAEEADVSDYVSEPFHDYEMAYWTLDSTG